MKKLDIENITGMEYHSIRIAIDNLNPEMDNEVSHNYTMQTMCVLEAMANASNDFWCCPGEDESNPMNYVYEPIEGAINGYCC